MRGLLLMLYANAGPKTVTPQIQKNPLTTNWCVPRRGKCSPDWIDWFICGPLCGLFAATPAQSRAVCSDLWNFIILSAPALRLALLSKRKLTPSLQLLSGLWLVPVVVGMIIGSSIRHMLAAMQF